MGRLRIGRSANGLSEILLAGAVLSAVALMIVPLPTWLLDLLLAANLSFSVLLLISAVFVRRALSFGAFPTILLLATLFRLALNVSSTRLILLQADAGTVIDAFGHFVVQGNYVVGAVVFLVLTLIQFVVIARGSERVAEVGARFTLDAMPGKQLAIDADLRSGLLDPASAGESRRHLERESQFYGAMDGAMKFVKGDAIASLAITGINLVGGVGIGLGMSDLGFAESLQTYGLLSIGDGLVSQIPSLLISTAAGLVVTRVASEEEGGSLAIDIRRQVFSDPKALSVAGVFALVLALVPGLPLFPFMVLGVALLLVAFLIARASPQREASQGSHSLVLQVWAGPALLARLSMDRGLQEALAPLSAQLYHRLGIRIGMPTLELDRSLEDDAYQIRLEAVIVAEGTCPGAPDEKACTEVAIEVSRVAESRPEALMGLQETQVELDSLRKRAPALVEAVLGRGVTLSQLAALLRALLQEGVSVLPLREILEALALDPLPESLPARTKLVRERLAKQLSAAHVDEKGVLNYFSIDPLIEDALREALRQGENLRHGGLVGLDPSLATDVIDSVKRLPPTGTDTDGKWLIIAQPDVRAALAHLLLTEAPGASVLSYNEVDPSLPTHRLGMVDA